MIRSKLSAGALAGGEFRPYHFFSRLIDNFVFARPPRPQLTGFELDTGFDPEKAAIVLPACSIHFRASTLSFDLETFPTKA